MKRNHYPVLYPVFLVALLMSCQSPKQSAYQKGVLPGSGKATAKTLLPPPVNSPGENEWTKAVYHDGTYGSLQFAADQFKETAPFIELLDSGRRERLWFTSSRADDLYYGEKKTNRYQQIYYCEREVGEGKAPGEGWGDVTLFELSTDHPFLQEFYRAFNRSTKGSLALAGDRLIFSCDLIGEGRIGDVKNLWELPHTVTGYGRPKPIAELSDDRTWESQPALSVNGKHLFFVSNRLIADDGVSVQDGQSMGDLNLFYSFREGETWRNPVPVKEVNTSFLECSPFIDEKSGILLFASNRGGEYFIYQVPVLLNDAYGGYSIEANAVQVFNKKLIPVHDSEPTPVELSPEHPHWFPFVYYNARNPKSPRALFWSSDQPEGLGSFDLHACTMPFEVELRATLADCSDMPGSVLQPLLSLRGYTPMEVTDQEATFHLYSGLPYRLLGGSEAGPQTGTYACDLDPSFIFIGYSRINANDPRNKALHHELLQGAEVESERTRGNGTLSFGVVLSDTLLTDTVFITRAWEQKPPCPGKLNIAPVHRSIAYFQTGFWEVNTTENLKRDLSALHEGFEVFPDKDLYHPLEKIERYRSDYKAFQWEDPLFPIRPDDGYTYSIANARWIELHPNNLYWGDRPGFDASREQRLKGRQNRIEQYLEYALKVDENLKNLTDTIRFRYIDLLEKHKDQKPILLIEIFAVSDQREVLRGWYIGDTVHYRGSEYDEKKKEFRTEPVKIVPPQVNERNKTLESILPCTLEWNSWGNNGSFLGINQEKTVLNTNLSRLRAWFGYREVLKRLRDDPAFERLLQKGRVALPENEVPYNQADIIIITRGKREDGDVKNPTDPYPAANNPSGNGYYDYDRIRRIEIQARLLFQDEKKVVENYCCDPNGVRFK